MSDQFLNLSQYCLIWCDSVDPFSCNLYLTHLLIDYLLPVIIPRFLVNPQCLLDSLGKLDTELVFCPPILGLCFGYDYIPIPQYLGNPLSKCQLVLYMIRNHILCDLDRV